MHGLLKPKCLQTCRRKAFTVKHINADFPWVAKRLSSTLFSLDSEKQTKKNINLWLCSTSSWNAIKMPRTADTIARLALIYEMFWTCSREKCHYQLLCQRYHSLFSLSFPLTRKAKNQPILGGEHSDQWRWQRWMILRMQCCFKMTWCKITQKEQWGSLGSSVCGYESQCGRQHNPTKFQVNLTGHTEKQLEKLGNTGCMTALHDKMLTAESLIKGRNIQMPSHGD